MPGHFSETRFATYSSVVIDKWLNNYYKIMNRKQDDNLDKTALPHSYLHVAVCVKPNIPSWEVSNIFEAHINALKKKWMKA